MNQILKYAAFSLGGVTLFVGAFLSFAAFTGAPLHEMSIVGEYFPAPPGSVATQGAEPNLIEELDLDSRSVRAVIEQASTPLRAFLLDSPFSTEDLEGLQRELKARTRTLETLQASLEGRERELALRERQIEERWTELERIRTDLIEEGLELEQRQDELVRDEGVARDREEASWQTMGKVFEHGEPEDLAERLVLLGPEQAAKVLRALTSERASEILNQVPREQWPEFAEAYRRAEQ